MQLSTISRSEGPGLRSRLIAITLVALIGMALVVPVLVLSRGDYSGVLKDAAMLAASRNSLTVSEPVRLLNMPRVILERGVVSFATEHTGKGLSGEAAASWLASGTARLMLKDATFLIETDFDGLPPPSWRDEPPLAPFMAALQRLSFETLALRNATIVLRRRGGSEEVLSKLSADFGIGRKQSLSGQGRFEYRGEAIVFDGGLDLSSMKVASGKFPIQGKVKGALVEASVDGRIQVDPEDLKLKVVAPNAHVKGADLKRFAAWLGATWPAGAGFGAFEAHGEVEWSSRRIEFEKAAFVLDGNAATGHLSLAFDLPRPLIEGTLASRSIDLLPYFPGLKPASNAAAPASAPADPAPFALPRIRMFDADVRVSSDILKLGEHAVTHSAVTLTLKDGKLLADIAEFGLRDGAKGVGQLRIDARTAEPSFAVRGRIEALQADKLAQYVLSHVLIEGPAVLTGDLTAVGGRLDGLRETLTGKLTLSSSQGGKLNGDLSALGAVVTEQAQAPPNANPGWSRAAKGSTTLDAYEARLAIANGRVSLDSVRGRVGEKSLSVLGSLNVVGRSCDVQLTLGPVEPTRAAPGADAGKDATVKPVGEEVTYRISGSWRSPLITRIPNPPRPPPRKSAKAGAG